MSDDIKARVERARELDAQATRGPWGFYQPMEFPKDWRISTGPNEPPYWIGRLTKAQASGLGSEPPREEDARFIAESRTLLPALAADCERLQEQREADVEKAMHWGHKMREARDREKERADRVEQSLAETAQLMVHAKDAARNAAPILRLHRQLIAAAKAGDDQMVNRIVAEMALLETA